MVDTVDPFAGSFAVERLTDGLGAKALELMGHVEALGGSVRAIEQGYMQREIEDAAYAYQMAVERDEKVIVGVNRFTNGHALRAYATPGEVIGVLRQEMGEFKAREAMHF